MLASRRPPPPKTQPPESGAQRALIASVLYYGVYCAFFGKMVLVLLERVSGGSPLG